MRLAPAALAALLLAASNAAIAATATLTVAVAPATAPSGVATIASQIHNAPGWQPGTSYTFSPGPPAAPFTRVLAGPGWVNGAWNSGQTLNAYQLTSAGTCTSAASGNGPSGTGSSIADGTCTWKYLSPVDYVSFTGWALDNGNVWTNGTFYGMRDVVNTGANSEVYQQQAAGCLSTIQPNNTSGADFATSDGCIWNYKGTIYYSSRAHPFPMEKFYYDSFQGYIAPATASFNGSVANNNVLTVDAISSGTIYSGEAVSGSGIAAGQTIYSQISGTTGGVGTYYLTNWQATAAETAITGSYGQLTVTVPPATHALDPTQPDIIANAAMAAPGRATGDSYGGTKIIAGSGNTFALNISQTVGSAANPVTLYHAQPIQVTYMFDAVYRAELWNDREYVAGQNGELNPLTTWNHNYAYNDTVQWTGEHALDPASTSGGRGFPFYIEAAPDEGFADTLKANSSVALAAYNPNEGVALRGTGKAALQAMDNLVVFKGLQATDTSSTPILAPARACNQCTFEYNLLQGGSGGPLPYTPDATSNCGYGCYWHNNLFITTGLLGVAADYGGRFYNNTFVCPSGKCGSAMSNTRDWVNPVGMLMDGNIVVGFQYFTSANFYGSGWSGNCTWDCATIQGTDNISDLPSTNGSSFPNSLVSGSTVEYGLPFQTGASFTAPDGTAKPICATFPNSALVPATCQLTGGVSPSGLFVNWPNNLRPNPSSPALGAGAHFAPFNLCNGTEALASTGAGSWPGCMVDPNTPDLLGNARPQGSRYDAGAVESP